MPKYWHNLCGSCDVCQDCDKYIPYERFIQEDCPVRKELEELKSGSQNDHDNVTE